MNRILEDGTLWSIVEKKTVYSLMRALNLSWNENYLKDFLLDYDKYRNKPLNFDFKYLYAGCQREWDRMIEKQKEISKKEKEILMADLTQMEALERELGWILVQDEKQFKRSHNMKKTYANPILKDPKVISCHTLMKRINFVREREENLKLENITYRECEETRSHMYHYLETQEKVNKIQATKRYLRELLNQMDALEVILCQMLYQFDHKQSILQSMLKLVAYFCQISEGNWILFENLEEYNQIEKGGMVFVLDTIFTMLDIRMISEKKEEIIKCLMNSSMNLVYVKDILIYVLEKDICHDEEESLDALNVARKSINQHLIKVIYGEKVYDIFPANYRTNLEWYLLQALDELGGMKAFLFKMQQCFSQDPEIAKTWICSLGNTVFKIIKEEFQEEKYENRIDELSKRYHDIAQEINHKKSCIERIVSMEEPIRELEKVKWGEKEKTFHSYTLGQELYQCIRSYIRDVSDIIYHCIKN